MMRGVPAWSMSRWSGLVHNRHVERRGDAGIGPAGDVVPEIVEADFSGGGEDYGIGVLEPALVGVHAGGYEAGRESERFHGEREGVAVAGGEVVVGGEDVNSTARRRRI